MKYPYVYFCISVRYVIMEVGKLDRTIEKNLDSQFAS